jgi:prepilin-type N-terminal cleavage/methylation domain-containing protein
MHHHTGAIYLRLPLAKTGFTLIETVVAVGVIGIGIATTIGALTQINSTAANSRNVTGAYTVLMNEVDLFQSMSPFQPQESTVPVDTAHGSYPTYDMTPTATPRQISVDGATWIVPIYEYKDQNNNVIEVVTADPATAGGLTETVTDLSTASPPLPNTYQAVFTITYKYRNRTYTYSMTAIRTSDS